MSTESITRMTERIVALDDPILLAADQPPGWSRKRPALEVNSFTEQWTSTPDFRGVQVDRYAVLLTGHVIRANGTRGSRGVGDRYVTDAAEFAALPDALLRLLLGSDVSRGEIDRRVQHQIEASR